MPRGFSKKESDRIKQTLIDEGIMHLKTIGIQRTRIEDLTSAVKISKGAFYKFFSSKEIFFFNILEIYEESLKNKFTNLLSKIEIDNVEDGVKNAIKEVVFSEEMQDYILFLKKDELAYILRNIDQDMLNIHQDKDQAFIASIYTLLSTYGIKTKFDPRKIMAYVAGLFCLFSERHIIKEEYFETVVDDYIQILAKAILEK